MPHGLVIDQEDVMEVAESFGCDFGDEFRLEALKCTSRRDIQACPGSGKTTLLVAKLAILSKKWKWPDRGVCVLSHTNVARQEVEERLATHPHAYQLLRYPHFIGTIQVFVDQFLALPFLRNRGIDIAEIDNDRFESRVWSLATGYHCLRVLMQQKKRIASAVLPGLRYEGESLSLGSAGGSIPVGESTPTFAELAELKKRISEEGIFRYDDMYAYAEAYLKEYVNLPQIMGERFPWVFIDEMQDTNAVQESLLNRLFSHRSIVQRFGDINQAIFGGVAGESPQISFPLPDAIDLPKSKRFGKSIATFVSPLTAIEPQVIEGDPNCKEQPHTVFLFEAATISEVLPAFCTLLAKLYPGGAPHEWPVKAIGCRKTPPAEGGGSKLPYCIGDYWQRFQPGATSRVTRPNNLVDFAREARRVLIREDEWREAYRALLEGIIGFLRRQEVKDESGATMTKTRLLAWLKEQGDKELVRFHKLLLDCGSAEALDQEYWQSFMSSLISIMAPWVGNTLTSEAWRFVQWEEADASVGPEKDKEETSAELINVYRFEHSSGLTIDTEVTTVHAAKGETHLATLVLETFTYGHDLKELVPFIIGQGDPKQFGKRRTRDRAQRVFVAMTRPKELLCLAVNKAHLDTAQIDALGAAGWEVQDLAVDS